MSMVIITFIRIMLPEIAFSEMRRGGSWPLTTLWQTDELSQSAPMYKHASLEKPAGCPSTIAVLTKCVAMLLLKAMLKCFGSLQMELCMVLLTSLV